MKVESTENNFLGIEDPALYSFENARFVVQQLPYEYTSSYISGSAAGPPAMISASHFVEFYDEELDQETYLINPVATLPTLDFKDKFDEAAMKLIEEHTTSLLNKKKFVVSFGAEHTITLGIARAFRKKFPDFCLLQFDAHSDLRTSYQGNELSHACVMARVHDLGIPLTQVGIRAQCKQESDLIKSSNNIHTFYAHAIRKNPNWMEDALATLGENVYISIDADGFDPSVIPNVGTAEPGGMYWNETLQFLRKVCETRNVIGFDIVEIAPLEGSIISEYTCAKLAYRLMGYISVKG